MLLDGAVRFAFIYFSYFMREGLKEFPFVQTQIYSSKLFMSPAGGNVLSKQLLLKFYELNELWMYLTKYG